MKIVRRTLFGGILVVMCTVSAHATDYYVAQDGQTPVYPFTNTWLAAASNIQDAVNAAAEFDTIWIDDGIYTLPTNAVEFIGTNVVYLDKLLSLIGASGDPADVVIDGQGLYRGIAVSRSAHLSTPLVLEALTIRNGYATNWGGGIYFTYGNYAWPCVIRDCVIVSNTVSSTNAATGGGMFASSVASAWSLSMSNSVLRGNIATNTSDVKNSTSGAAYLRCTGLKEFVNCIIEDNWAGKNAGGLYPHQGTLYAINTVFEGNKAAYSVNAGSGGGAIYSSGSQLDLRNCLFVKNRSAGQGGGVCLQQQHGSSYNIEMRNCTFVSNYNRAVYIRNWASAQGYFPALHLWNSSLYANWPEDLSLPPTSVGAPVTNYFTNCVFTSTNFDFNLVSDGLLATNPVFRDLHGLDFRLGIKSPCINAGVNQDWMVGALDLDGNPRIDWGTVDIGAYEHVTYGTIITVE